MKPRAQTTHPTVAFEAGGFADHNAPLILNCCYVAGLSKKFVADFKKANPNLRPDAVAVFGYDGTRVIYEALKQTGGKGGGDGGYQRIAETVLGGLKVDGNIISHDDQWRKLERVVEVARDVWGDTGAQAVGAMCS